MEITELATVSSQNAVQIFTQGGMESILENIEAKVRAIPLDPSTPAGREEIRSVAYKISRTKSALDAEGKKLTEGWRDATSKVNAERRKSSAFLENLAEEIRKPLTDFEAREESRLAGHELALQNILAILSTVETSPDLTLDKLVEFQGLLRDLNPDREWEEYYQRATKARADLNKVLDSRLEARKKYEVEQEELARLRREEQERLQRERDEKLRVEAADKATREAERVAREAAEKEKRRVFAEAEKVRIENERRQKELEAGLVAAEKRAADIEAAKVKAVADAKAAHKKAEAGLVAAQEKAKRDLEAAAARERARIAKEQQLAVELRAKQEADKRLNEKIHLEIANDCAGKSANEIATAIMAGRVRHVRVEY